jgi:hypothetical protein
VTSRLDGGAHVGAFVRSVSQTSSSSTLDDLLAYLGAAPTPYHAVAETRRRLVGGGFRELSEREPWDGLAPGRYFVVAGETTLIAFVLPHGRKVGGFRIVGAHTDSPNLRLKPKPDYTKEGYAQLGVEVYGGALLNSWLDRDLGIAGRLLVREGESIVPKLVTVARPMCRVAQLAIHLDRDVNDGLKLNRQEHLAPIFGLGPGDDVLTTCAKEVGVARDTVVAHELMLFDVTKPTRGAGRTSSSSRPASTTWPCATPERTRSFAPSPRPKPATSSRCSRSSITKRSAARASRAQAPRSCRACSSASRSPRAPRGRATSERSRAPSASRRTWPTPCTRTTTDATSRATSPC